VSAPRLAKAPIGSSLDGTRTGFLSLAGKQALLCLPPPCPPPFHPWPLITNRRLAHCPGGWLAPPTICNCLCNIFRYFAAARRRAVRRMGGGTVVLWALPFRRSGLSGVWLSAQHALVAAGRLSSLHPPHDCPPSLPWPWPPDLDLGGWRGGWALRGGAHTSTRNRRGAPGRASKGG
jgi:hypothetical protein